MKVWPFLRKFLVDQVKETVEDHRLAAERMGQELRSCLQENSLVRVRTANHYDRSMRELLKRMNGNEK
jgi:hypothetical protein